MFSVRIFASQIGILRFQLPEASALIRLLSFRLIRHIAATLSPLAITV